jgi:alpha-galactosidase
MAWWRSPVIPASVMIIGNQKLEDPEFELSLMSLTGSLPVVLGDPRLLNAAQRAHMKSWAGWLRAMQEKHDFTSFRQDLKGYGEPAEGNWDGFQRINTETRSGGIAGIFRQGSAESHRRVTIQYLEPDGVYEVRKAPGGEIVYQGKGENLASQGFGVDLPCLYDGAVFEIRRAD